MSEILIRGGTVVDGTGAPARKEDVRVRDGRVVEIAPNLTVTGGEVIDATDALVTPGFIDCHTHLDAAMFWDPTCDSIAQHGVTTVLIGNCSLGLAPARPKDRSQIADLFSYLEDIPLDALMSLVPWKWETFPEYAAELTKAPLAVNIVSLVSHSLLRIYVMGEDAWERAATPEEIEQIAGELSKALDAGALGLSFSLFDKDRTGRRVPTAYADDAELDRLFQEVGARKGVFQLITSGTVSEDLDRVGPIAARHGVTVLHNALLDLADQPERSGQQIAALARLRSEGARMFTMMSPRTFDVEVNFHATLCFINYPVWNEVIQAPQEKKRALLAAPEWRARARAEFASVTHPLFPVDQSEAIRISAIGPGVDPSWIDRSLKDLVEARGGDISDVLADWVLENDLQAKFVFPLGNTNLAKVGALLRCPEVLVGGSDAGAHVQMFCATGDTTLFLSEYVRDRAVFSIEEGIHQLTGRQAEILNLPDRGRLEVGSPADIVVFRLEELSWEPQYLVRDPVNGEARYTRPAGGFRYTLINGEIVQQTGMVTPARPADFLPAPVRTDRRLESPVA